jgi:catechol 2,3-dioxygenase-like lactoylglutathione lyase family enzyme
MAKDKPNYVRFNHVMLYVSDLDKSIDFYRNAFPIEVEERVKKLQVSTGEESQDVDVNMALLRFKGQDFILELSEQNALEDSDKFSPHYQHLGINVLDIQKAHNRLIAAGAIEVSPIRQIRANDTLVKNSFYSGPDGESIELMQVFEGKF